MYSLFGLHNLNFNLYVSLFSYSANLGNFLTNDVGFFFLY